MNIELKTIKPIEAKRILENNTRNRPLNQRHVNRLSSDMGSGRWKFNGDSIRLNGDCLIDGQHRLTACINSGIPLKTIVISGLDSDAFDTIDTGKTRNGSDTLSLLGEKNTHNLAAALGFLIKLRDGTLKSRPKITNSAIRRELETHPRVRASLSFVCSIKNSKIAPLSVLTGLHYVFSKIDKDTSDRFIESLLVGDNLSSSSPIFMTRDRLISSRFTGSEMPRDYYAGIIIKGWNLFFMDKTAKRLIYTENEKFPDVCGR